MSRTRILNNGQDDLGVNSWKTPAVKEDKDEFVASRRQKSRVYTTEEEIDQNLWDTPDVKKLTEDLVIKRRLVSNVILRDETPEDVETWDTPDFGDRFVANAHVEAQADLDDEIDPQMLTAEGIEEIQRQAYAEAFELGKKEGYEKGMLEGQETGYQEGLMQGKEEGLALGKAEAEPLCQEIRHILEKLAHPLEELDSRVENELVQLAMAVAQHLVRRELKTDPGHIIAAVREAVGILPISLNDIRVYLHPEDAALVKQILSLAEQEDEDDRRWSIVEDATLTRGGCTVESENSHLDATVESRIAAVVAQVLGGERENDARDE